MKEKKKEGNGRQKGGREVGRVGEVQKKNKKGSGRLKEESKWDPSERYSFKFF